MDVWGGENHELTRLERRVLVVRSDVGQDIFISIR